MGKFASGTSGNPAGRPKGSANKITGEMRERIQRIVDALEEDVINDLKRLEPRERVKTYVALLEYVTPKLTRASMEHECPEIKLPVFYWADGNQPEESEADTSG